MPVGKPRSYAWARHLEATEVTLAELSPAAVEGWEWALELAEDAYERSRDPRRWQRLQPLTIDQLADEYDLPVTTIVRRIALARRQFFGALSDAAIYKRLQRHRGRTNRPCAHPGCTTLIPITARANKQYCPVHGSGKERVRRHRHRLSERASDSTSWGSLVRAQYRPSGPA